VSEHTLSTLRQHISRKKEVTRFAKLETALNIKSNSPDDMITSLSGGNQQKVIIGRWLNTRAEVLLMDNPTQGIDVGAKAEIYKLIHQLAKDGKTILVNTLEIPELQQVADRCVVFYHGHLQTELSREQMTEENVMLWATNAINTAEVAK
ncbi:MAG: ATP-binding cassette domain-containing protein, partial [Oscillospiraceae bacterium]